MITVNAWLNSKGVDAWLPAVTPDADGVRVSTIHAAKGLEADGVLLLDAHHLQTRADAEARRLLYIAMTRARHDLAISYFRDVPLMAELTAACAVALSRRTGTAGGHGVQCPLPRHAERPEVRGGVRRHAHLSHSRGRGAGPRRHLVRRPRRRVPLDRRPLRLRQEHARHAHRGPHATDVRGDRRRRSRGEPPADGARHRVSERGPPRLAQRPRQRAAPGGDAGPRRAAVSRPRDGAAPERGARRLRAAPPPRALGRHAAARRDLPGADPRPAAPLDGRAVRRARCPDTRPDDDRHPGDLCARRQDRALHHALASPRPSSSPTGSSS